MKAIKLPALHQGDLILVNLTGTKLKKANGKITPGKGWLLVNEVSIHGEVINANFKPDGTKGYGNIIWPAFEALAFVRGSHGECSPFAAFNEMFGKVAAIALE